MPHHSAHQRQASAATLLPPSPGLSAGAVFSMASPALSFPPPQTAFSPTAVVGGSQTSPVPPLVASHAWPATDKNMVHRVGSHAEGDAAARSAAATPTRRVTSAGSHSFDSPHGVAASVLLLAASKIREDEEAASSALASLSPAPTAAAPGGPLKKRRGGAGAAASILRPKVAEAPHRAHVSPISHGTHPSASMSSTPNSAATSPGALHRAGEASHASGTSPSSSYELRDGQALLDSAKIHDAREIACPPSHVEIPHFPSVLHAVLTESEFAGSVLRWLPHGQGWRIVRWDALRRQVLPKYFAPLREEKDDASGSIDAFLWHLQAWGFEEIIDGPDAGAYTHVLFRRELPQLCREMRFAPSPSKRDDLRLDGDESRSILRVPSLNAREAEHREEEKKDDDPPSHMVPPVWRAAANVPYRNGPYPMMRPEAWHMYSTEPPRWLHSAASHESSRPAHPYSPVRVRSGRGACRAPHPMGMTHHRPAPTSPPSTAPQDVPGARVGFPVSNRGRGGPGARRILAVPARPTPEPAATAAPAVMGSPSKARPLLKRKLPISTTRSSEEETWSDSDDESSASADSDSKRHKVEAASSVDSMEESATQGSEL